MNKNGLIIQRRESCGKLNIDFPYDGLSSLPLYPLLGVRDKSGAMDSECLEINKKVFSKCLPDGMWQPLEFISSYDLYARYVEACRTRNIPIRILFVESDYKEEIWNGPDLLMKFLGYEISPIPIDDVVVYDLQYSTKLREFRNRLNQYGLFTEWEQAVEFHKVYTELMHTGEVGDGETETIICKVFEVIG